jgi:hypothetical protein
VGSSPRCKFVEGWLHRLSTSCQVVFDADGRPGKHRPFDESHVHELVEAIRKGSLANAVDRSSEFGEACGTVHELAEDKSRPALSEEREHRPELVVRAGLVFVHQPRLAVSREEVNLL